MDLTGQVKLKHEYYVDENTGVITLTFKDDTDSTLGTLEIEEGRLRPLMDALFTSSKELYDIYAQGVLKHRTSLNVNEKAATTEFFA